MIHMGIYTLVLTLAIGLGSCSETTSQSNYMKEETTIPAGLTTDTATFATGCFWCTEAIFQRLNAL